jgi:hypothetical protein
VSAHLQAQRQVWSVRTKVNDVYMGSCSSTDSAVMNSVSHPSQKQQAFQMSGHDQDCLELDNDRPDGASCTYSIGRRERKG